MASIERVGGAQYIGTSPSGELIPTHDDTLNDNLVVGHAVLAGPVTFAATIIIEGVVVII